MGIKIRALGLGLIAMLAMSAMSAMNASATTTGHFVQDSGGTATITGTSTGTHKTKTAFDGGTPIECDVVHLHGKMATATSQELLLTPTYSQCHTEGQEPGTMTIDTNECHWKLTSHSNASTHTPTTHATTGIRCPVGAPGIVITHPNCTMRMPPQTVKGVTYTTIFQNGKHAITLNETVHSLTTHYEAGICIFLGTAHTASMTGSLILEAFNNINEPVNLTAT